MAGKTLRELGLTEDPVPEFISAKEVVLPFIKFPGVDILLGPEMRSTGEVMGIDYTMGMAFAKSQIAAGNRLPAGGTVFISLNDRDKRKMGSLGKDLAALGFKLFATEGTAALLGQQGIEVERVYKVGEKRPHIVDRMINGDVHWVINTPLGEESMFDEKAIRRTALERGITHMTTLAAAHASVMALKAERDGTMSVRSLQEYHADSGTRPHLLLEPRRGAAGDGHDREASRRHARDLPPRQLASRDHVRFTGAIGAERPPASQTTRGTRHALIAADDRKVGLVVATPIPARTRRGWARRQRSTRYHGRRVDVIDEV